MRFLYDFLVLLPFEDNGTLTAALSTLCPTCSPLIGIRAETNPTSCSMMVQEWAWFYTLNGKEIREPLTQVLTPCVIQKSDDWCLVLKLDNGSYVFQSTVCAANAVSNHDALCEYFSI